MLIILLKHHGKDKKYVTFKNPMNLQQSLQFCN